MDHANDAEVRALRAQATALAGRPGDLVQRATVYHHLYRHSGGNHVFPLLAAHGALWASGYFRRGLTAGAIAARAMTLVGADGARRLAALHALAETFRDINRRVCVETWFIYYLSSRDHLAAEAERLIPFDLRALMRQCHEARRGGHSLSAGQRRALFTAFFRWEQAAIVGPAVEKAFAGFDWPLASRIALRPRVAFAYLPAPLPFNDFANTAERIDKGLAAYDGGETIGWCRVEQSLSDYGIMPAEFARDPAAHLRNVLRGVVGLFATPAMLGA